MKFFILMVDYGKSFPGKQGPSGLEAVVQPELTRRQIIEQVSDILAEDRNTIAFVKFVDGNFIEDITDEILSAAKQMEAA